MLTEADNRLSVEAAATCEATAQSMTRLGLCHNDRKHITLPLGYVYAVAA